MQLDSTILAEYKKITGKDITPYLQSAITFFEGDYNTIVNYYRGVSKTISSEPFANFKELQRQNRDALESFKEHSRQFNNLKWWILVEQLEEIDSRLSTLSKINKWTRSNITKVGYDPSFQVDYTLQQNQTLESVAAGAGSQSPNDDWADIAIQNSLEEEDYTPEGGVKVSVSMNRTNGNFRINSVVDVISGKSIYGKDLDKQLQWTKENGYLSLKTLNYSDTILQAIEILAKLRKNDNPDNPNSGLQTSLVAGTNRALFNFPVIIRQMNQTFANDDTLKNFKILNLKRDQDNIMMEFTVQTRLNEVLGDTTAL